MIGLRATGDIGHSLPVLRHPALLCAPGDEDTRRLAAVLAGRDTLGPRAPERLGPRELVQRARAGAAARARPAQAAPAACAASDPFVACPPGTGL